MPAITSNVEFDTVAREWRCKWDEENDKASLSAAQDALGAVLADVKAIDGVKAVQRVVCGGCHDFKVGPRAGGAVAAGALALACGRASADASAGRCRAAIVG